MSAYRAAPPSAPAHPRDVRELTIRTLGTFGIAVWSGLVVVTGVVMAAALRWGSGPGFDVAGALRTLAIATVVGAVLVAVLVALLDQRFRFVVRVEEGVIEVSKRRVVGRAETRAFQLRDVARVSVDEHGEDHVAVFVHSREHATPVFTTKIGDDARRVEAFLDEGVSAWRAFTIEPTR